MADLPEDPSPGNIPEERTDAKNAKGAHRRGQFDAFCREHFAFVKRCLRLFGIPDAVVEDLRQEVFLIAYEKDVLPPCADESRKYLYVIAALLTANYRRLKQHRVLVPQDSESPIEPTHEPRLDDRLEARTLLPRVYEALTPKLRDVMPCLSEELSAEEGAKRLGITIKAYETRVRLVRETAALLFCEVPKTEEAVEPERTRAASKTRDSDKDAAPRLFFGKRVVEHPPICIDEAAKARFAARTSVRCG